MSINKLWLVLVSIFFIAATTHAQAMSSSVRNVAEMKLTPLPGLPTCVLGSVQSGDPAKGGSIIFAKVPSGCSIPWHWHTATEQVMIISGVARVDMKDGKPTVLRSGGFAMLPSHHLHQFVCQESCQMYISSDVAFDIHYVDAQGKEIPAANALKTAKEKVATQMK